MKMIMLLFPTMSQLLQVYFDKQKILCGNMRNSEKFETNYNGEQFDGWGTNSMGFVYYKGILAC